MRSLHISNALNAILNEQDAESPFEAAYGAMKL